MSQHETLDLLQDIQTLVCDKLRVVSYKWLSRNYSLSSNAAKRLLQEYVDKNEEGFEVVYALAGQPKNDPSTYCIKLVSASNLQELKVEFQGDCSIHVYSVQACLPKDPATLWNAEIIQSEELYKQPATVDNCLRDNRFGGISNSSVERNVQGTPINIASHRSRGLTIPASSNSNFSGKIVTAPHFQQSKVQEPRAEGSLKPTKSGENFKTTTSATRIHEQPAIEKETAPRLATNGTKGQNDSVGTVNGGSLANMWGRASKKPKPTSPVEETAVPLPPSASADAQISAAERAEDRSSDEEEEHVNVRRASRDGGRKRRVVFDSSEDEDDTKNAMNLASPDVPKEKSCSEQKKIVVTSPRKETNMDIDFDKDCKPALNEDKATFSKIPEGKDTADSSLKNMKNNVPKNEGEKKEKPLKPVPTLAPERKKVLKTHIDERGREVTEVVWEGEDEKKKSDESSKVKKSESIANSSNATRPTATNKNSPAVAAPPNAPSGKAGSKKAGNSNDPKQGNIMSFFKRV